MPSVPARATDGWRRRLPTAGALALAAASVAATQLGTVAAAVVNTGTVVVLAVLLLSGDKRRDAIRRTRWLLLAALGTAFVSGLMTLGYQLATGAPPPRPWVTDAVALAYVPLTVAGLLLLPAGPRRSGHRIRALSDGALAASALWYLLLAAGLQHARDLDGTASWAHAVALAYPVGDVFVVSTALAVLARCTPSARRMVGWLALGLSVVAANDVWSELGPRQSAGPTLLYQVGLLMLLGAAAAPAVRDRRSVEQPVGMGVAFGLVPFLPLLGAMVATARMTVDGQDMPHSLVLPALVVGIALTVRQLTGARDRERLVAQLLHRERHLEAALRQDELTGLANHLGANERLREILADPTRWPVTVAMLDLNDFKLINDTQGHAVGDHVLRDVASRLTKTVRGDDLVARLGGDEFAVIAAGVGESHRERMAGRLVEAFEPPVHLGNRRLPVSASIGIVTGQPPETADELLAHADAAMYQAKEDKRRTSKVTVLSQDDRSETTRRLRMREEIARPDSVQFHVLYQPVVDLTTGWIRGVEALMRWDHPVLGLIMPEEFIPLAEQAGTIGVLGERVLTTAIDDLGRLRLRYPEHRLAVGVNVSPGQLTDVGFVDRVTDLLARNRLLTDQLVLEITEQAFETDLDAMAATVDRLVSVGVSVAVDDFGTGYASLRYLQRLRLEILKLDRSFVADITTSPAGQQLVSAVATMGTSLGLQLVAEGIETLDHLRLLQEMDCELGQGYLFSPPVTIGEIERLLAADHVYPVQLARAAAPAQLPPLRVVGNPT